MLKLQDHPNQNDSADYAASPGPGQVRLILPGKYLAALSGILTVSAAVMVLYTPLLSSNSAERVVLSEESRKYIFAEQQLLPADINTTDDSLENYEDFDIPRSMFQRPALLQAMDQDAAARAAAEEAVAEVRPEGTWYQQTVKRGDSLSAIFSYLNLPQHTLAQIIVAAAHPDLFLQPGQKIQFLIDENDVLKELVKPLQTAGQQVRFTRLRDDEPFRAVYEAIDSHVEDPQLIAGFAEAASMPSAVQAAAARQKKAEALALKKAQAEAERKSAAPADPLRPRLVYGTMLQGENFAGFARRIGLTPTEVKSIEQILSPKGKTSQLRAGDSLRVLFNSIGTTALINAVAVDSRKLGSLSFYRNPQDKNFYEEGGYIPTAGIFRRFPLAIGIKVNSPFNLTRRHPVTRKVTPHKGVDLKAPVGTPVYAPADGLVTFAGYQRAAGYYMIVSHARGISTVYMHLSKIDVKQGTQIYAGQVIARTGNTGRTTGPHLHYEVRINDNPVDPLKIDLPGSSHPNLAREQREAFTSSVTAFKHDLFDDSLAQNK